MAFDCTKCIHDEGADNTFFDIHEICDAGNCMLCMHRDHDTCPDFKPKIILVPEKQGGKQ